MQRLANVHPSDLTKFPLGSGKIALNASNEGSKILMYNETPLNIDLDFLNGKSDVLHAWEANFWTLDGDTKEIDWNIDVDSLNVVNPPINAIFLTLYDPIEKLNDKAYPMPLIRQIGGQQAIVSSASQVINDGNALQQVVEATLQGHGSSDVIINNDGSFTLKGVGTIGGVNFSLGGAADHAVLKPVPAGGMYIVDSNGNIHFAFDTGSGNSYLESAGAGSSILIQPEGGTQMTLTALLTTISNALALLSTLTMNNNTAIKSKDSGGTARNMLSMDATNKTHVGSGAVGAEVRFDDSAGTQMGWFNSGGGGNVNGTFKSPTLGLTAGGGGNFAGLAGTLSRFTFFTGSGTGTYSHSQGVTPQWVAAIANVAGSFTQGFDTPTSTQVHITCGAALAFTACVLNS